jgi:hypothetical protein
MPVAQQIQSHSVAPVISIIEIGAGRMENQHKKITGYRDLAQSEIDGMNSIKALEADAGELFKQIAQIEGVDPHLLALAKTNLQQGFMWFVRSIAKPADPFA